MKKNLFFAACVLLLAACSSMPENGYTVTGKTSLGNDGDSVFMRHSISGATDTAILNQGVFVFSGATDTLEFCTLSYRFSGGAIPMSTQFFLEPGNIAIDLETRPASVTGTLCNDRLKAFQDSLQAFLTVMKPYQEVLASQTATEEEKAAAQAELDKSNEQFPQILAYFIELNADNEIGIYLFVRMARNLDAETANSLIEKFPEAKRNLPEIQKVKASIEAILKTAVGQPFVDFELPGVDGTPIKLSDIVAKNKVTLIDFWASWCGPCRGEMPNVVEAYKNYKKAGFEILGVSLDSKEEAWKKAIKDLNITWPQASDLKGWGCVPAQQYAVSGIPATVLIAQDGTILARNLRGDDLSKKLDEVLK